MKSWTGWLTAALLGGALGWGGSAFWSQRPVLTEGLPLLDVSPTPIRQPAPSPTPQVAPPDAPEPSSPADAEPAARPAGHERGVRSIIDRELPHATAEERDIWFEQFKDLPPGIVEDLLNVRKQFRQMVPPLSPTPIVAPSPPGLPAALAPSPQPLSVGDDWSSTREALGRLRQVTLHNLANADTVGYRRLEPVIGSDAERRGVRWEGTRLDLRPGPRRTTHRPLDVAIDGPGWFVVADGETLSVTRRGQFSIRAGALSLPAEAGRFLPVHPLISVPAEVQRVEIAAQGAVLGWTADENAAAIRLGQLELAWLSDAGLAALDAGEPLPRETLRQVPPETQGVGSLVVGSLEDSNVIVAEERTRLEWINDWLRHAGAAIAEPGPQP